MKILQLIQKSQLRGAEMFACQLSNELIKSGNQLKVVALFDGEAKLPFPEVLNLGANQKKRLFDFYGFKALSNIINEFDPDIVQANAGDTLKYASLSKRLFGWRQPLVFRNANKMGDFIDSTPKKIFNQFLVNKCDGVASVSELCRQDFVNTFKFKESRTRNLPIGTSITTDNFSWPDDLKEYCSDGPILVNIASLVPEKNHLGLISLFEKVRAKWSNAKLLIVGDGKLRQSVLNQVESLGLQDSVKLLGYRNDAAAILQCADLFVLPSKIEGLPGVILEAFMMKTPVIANNVGGISEVVRDGDTGMLVDENSADKFVAACLAVLENKTLSNQLTTSAFNLVKKEYDNRVIAERFVSFYKEIISQEEKK
ncbi:glycosyltransferase family 4 protein [Roseivirga pacifica]|uniref:glycosyltransferase family 4 protein n=1 Tax=Roseivirga pacifica TaxID=1267423 RepID=UPI00227B65C9|nr:glycosyltransferase family 4 protein [Roseivirga pacifica]